MDNKNLQLMLIVVIVAIIVCLFVWIIGAIGSMNLTNGCLYRYSTDSSGNLISSDSVTNTVIVKANGNYTVSDTGNTSQTLTLSYDLSSYGKWVNSDFLVKEEDNIDIKITGDVSLCQSYLPLYNIEKDSDSISGARIKIPRVEDGSTSPLPMIFDAKIGEWRNVVELYPNDYVVIGLSKEQFFEETTQVDVINNSIITANCTDEKREYNPICGRFSVWGPGDAYVTSCTWVPHCYQCNCRQVCNSPVFIFCWTGTHTECDWCGCYQNVYGIAPEPYSKFGFFTFRRKDTIEEYFANFNKDCQTDSEYILGQYQSEKLFWFSANDASNLYYRKSQSLRPSDYLSMGTGFAQTQIRVNDTSFGLGSPYGMIYNEVYSGSDVKYLQFRFGDFGDYANNTGGYILNVKHTKCRRKNGNGLNDTFEARGLLEYAIVPIGVNPNATSNGVKFGSFVPDVDGKASLNIPSDGNGNIWLRIRNNPVDYQDSFGQYQVQFFGKISKGKFLADILEPLFETLKSKITDASRTIFKNMTCYQGIGAQNGNCNNFFNYIRGILILYIMIYGALFLIGAVQISQMDIVTRVIKVALVAGLINENTFNFFNTYVFDFVTHFSDEIIANMSGYSTFTASGSIRNPFQFLDAVMTKIFLSKTFAAQIMALIAMGLNGFIYFILIMVALIFVVIAALRAIAIYLMAFIAVAILIGLAPLFLTFILFDFTKELFENWVRFTFRYMVEPVIMLAGIIILCQLFTIYLDYTINYSVCWKCALPIKLPFPNIPGISVALLNVPIFCINWFAPWGYDNYTGQMGLSMTNMVVLLMLAICMKGYVDFAGRITSRIAGGSGGPSATRMGSAMASAIGESGLSKIGLDAKTRAQMKRDAKNRVMKTVGDIKDGKGILPRGSAGPQAQGINATGSQATGSQAPVTKEFGMKAPENTAAISGSGMQAGIQAGMQADSSLGPGSHAVASQKKASSWKSVNPSERAQNLSKESSVPRFGGHRSEIQNQKQIEKSKTLNRLLSNDSPESVKGNKRDNNNLDNSKDTTNERDARTDELVKKAGIGDRYKNMTEEQKAKARERFAKRRGVTKVQKEGNEEKK